MFCVMITVKERIDYNEMRIDEFTVYDLYSEVQENKKSLDSPSMVSLENSSTTTHSHYQVNNEKPFGSSSTVSKRTFRGQYQMVTYSINDLIEFVKCSMTKIQ